MKFYKRAIKYLLRKRAKTTILFFVLLILNTMVLCGITTLRASEEGKNSIQKKTQTKLFVEIREENSLLSDEEVKKISTNENVESINRISKVVGHLKDGMPITGSSDVSEINNQIKLYGYDDYKQDGPINDSQIRLYEGKLPQKSNQALIHRDLAKMNGWKIGDEIWIESINGEEIPLQISGVYFSRMEDEQSDDLQSVYRIENQIYTMSQQILHLQKNKGYEKVIVYLNNPEKLTSTKKIVEGILKDKAEIAEADALYNQLKYPLEQISQIMKLILELIIATSSVIVTLLLCMWVRARKKEIAIYISLGETKCKILCQIFLETLLVFWVSFAFSIGIGAVVSRYIEDMLTFYIEKEIALNVAIKAEDLMIVLFIGGIILMIGIVISLIPVIGTNPKDTLSEMEG